MQCVRIRRVAFAGLLATLASAVVLGSAGAVRADDSGNFVVTLGRDTTSVEHYDRTATGVVVDQVGRSPRVLRRHFSYGVAKGALSHFTMVVTPPGGTTPTQTVEASFDADSLRLTTQSGSAPAQKSAVVVPKGAVVVANSSPWVGYEGAIMKCIAGKSDTLGSPLWFLGASDTNWLTVTKAGRDSVVLASDRGDIYRVHVDKAGHILDVRPIQGPAQYSVHRVAKLDLDARAAEFAARDKAGAGLGVLSPRDTVSVANAGGASLMIDYGRPAKRGRAIFGGVVAYGQVWRTGANAATQFKTDKALDFGGTVVPAGFYTLWTLPTATGWKLIVNGETGQWGTEHKPEKDLYSIDMKVSTLPQAVERFTIRVEPAPQGGTLDLEWDTTQAAAAFVVRP